MQYSNLPGTDLKVSKICMGSMTWGQQNTEAEGHKQLDYALEKGINFIDTAEMYPVPANPKTQGSTESIIGSWLQKTGKRREIVLASKITGPAEMASHVRQPLDFSKKSLEDALHKSLKRLQTDYLDLYQLHWPERNSNFFGKRDYKREEDEKWKDDFRQILEHLEVFINEGKIRNIGLSNESPYGLMRFLEESRSHRLPKMITVQNPYNLLNRKDEIGLTEIYHRENVGLLPYSPLGMGTLSGKHLEGIKENTRLSLFPQYTRYSGDQAVRATKAYKKIAEKHGLNFAQMALAFVNSQPFVTSNIIGATSREQLQQNIESIEVELSEEIMEEINAVHAAIPNPAP